MMRHQNIFVNLLVALWGVTMVAAMPRQTDAALDQSLYRELLTKYVHDGVVDYQGLKQEETTLDQYLALFDQTDPETLERNDQFAFFINAYNAYTLKLILEHYPVDSIKDTGGFLKSPWKIEFCRIGGKMYTLDEIEHEILRPRFKDPRVHFAVNCASKSCPPLISIPYEGETLDEQLEANTIAFLHDPNNNYLEGQTLYVSRIFKWFGGDFNNDIVGFFVKYAQGDLRERLLAQQETINVKYLDYDWSLNGH